MMGLDQNLYAVDESACDQDGNIMNHDAMVEIGYWRKHAALQGHIEQLWNEAGQPRPNKEGAVTHDFNCIPFELSEEQILHIIECSKNKSFGDADGTTGFFFGSTQDRHHNETIQFMTEALEEMRAGKRIFYDSWW